MARSRVSVLPERCPAGLRSSELTVEDAHLLVLSYPIDPPLAPGELTRAERDVLRRVCEGCSNSEIARARGTSLRTVANQVASIFGKMGVGSRAELFAVAERGG